MEGAPCECLLRAPLHIILKDRQLVSGFWIHIASINHFSKQTTYALFISTTMKLSALLAVGSTSLALAAPTTTVEKRADFCGQWDSKVTGAYTVYNNLWGQAQATSGSQCTGVDSLSGSTLKWHTSWSWAGGFVMPSILYDGTTF